MFEDEKLEDAFWFEIAGIVALLPLGPTLLSLALGEAWSLIGPKTRFGILFKRRVKAGMFPNITIGPKTTENHQLYCVTA